MQEEGKFYCRTLKYRSRPLRAGGRLPLPGTNQSPAPVVLGTGTGGSISDLTELMALPTVVLNCVVIEEMHN